MRRVGLIRIIGVPLAVTGWLGHHERDGGERWIIDPTFAEGHGATGHRRLMALLAAPGWGLPVTPVDNHCNCHLPPEYSDQCTTITADAAGRRGALEVRTIHRSGGRLKWIQQHRPTIYAAQQQLALPVPAWVDGWLERGGSRAFPREGGHAVIDHAASVSLAVWCRCSYSLGLRWPLAAECRRRVL